MSPFSSTIDGGRSVAPVRSVSAFPAASVVADARIHRLGCRRWPLEQPPFLPRLERPGHTAARADVVERRRRGDRTAAALDTKAAVLLDKALPATDLSGRGGEGGERSPGWVAVSQAEWFATERTCFRCAGHPPVFAESRLYPSFVTIARPARKKKHTKHRESLYQLCCTTPLQLQQ